MKNTNANYVVILQISSFPVKLFTILHLKLVCVEIQVEDFLLLWSIILYSKIALLVSLRMLTLFAG